MSQALMQIWECLRCRTRYGQRAGETLSSCPHCKSEERAPLAEEIRPLSAPSEEAYFDLWRYSAVAPGRFLEILDGCQASLLSRCPTCGTFRFIHMSDCWLGLMTQAESQAFRASAVQPGHALRYRCDRCQGSLWTLVEHVGTPEFYVPCRASMGCKGMMGHVEADSNDEPPEAGEIPWRWIRPARREGLQAAEIDHAVNHTGLVLRRRVLEGQP